MYRTKIDWADYSWNPVKGRCPVKCWYCYARKLYDRFKWMEFLEADDFEEGEFPLMPDMIYLDERELERPLLLYPRVRPCRIFCGSTIEVFHPQVRIYFQHILDIIAQCPQHTFIILSKRINEADAYALPDNVWLGATVTGEPMLDLNAFNLTARRSPRIRFLNFEPLLAPLKPNILAQIKGVSWVVVGALTGHGARHRPKPEWVAAVIREARAAFVPIFLKNNLREAWNDDLIQEFPKEEKMGDKISAVGLALREAHIRKSDAYHIIGAVSGLGEKRVREIASGAEPTYFENSVLKVLKEADP